jgi:hypothetical protein
LSISDLSGNLVAIQHLQPNEAIKVVGIYQSVDGSMDTQIQHFTDKLINIGNCIHDNWVPHCLAWQGFQTMVWQSLKYPLATCSLTKTQGKTLTTQLYKFFLPKLGIN